MLRRLDVLVILRRRDIADTEIVVLIDPKASDQNNNFGIGNIPAAQDYEDIKAAQQSFAMMAGYLNGSTINVTYKNNPQRYTGAYVTEEMFKIIGVSPVLGRDFTAEDNKPGSPKDRDSRRRNLAPRFQCRSEHRRPERHD